MTMVVVVMMMMMMMTIIIIIIIIIIISSENSTLQKLLYKWFVVKFHPKLLQFIFKRTVKREGDFVVWETISETTRSVISVRYFFMSVI